MSEVFVGSDVPSIILSFLTAFTLTYFAIPSIISIAREKRLFDEPVARSSHTISTPSLGGIAIFAGAIFSIVLWAIELDELQYILCAFIILFLIGAKDDISPVSPYKKLTGQILAASILVFKSDIKLTSSYGLFNLNLDFVLGPWILILLSILTILVITNAFNLIDGINGLAGSIGALIMVTLGCWFLLVDQRNLAIVAFSSAGAVIAFLKYNYSPAQIFMGDTGALFIGLTCSILLIKFIEFNGDDSLFANRINPAYQIPNAPAVAFGVMILPLFDTLRVFITRIYRGKSPFYPDRRHIHHLLIDFGFTHMQATSILVFINALFILFAFSMSNFINLNLLVFLIFFMAILLTFFLHKSVIRKKRI